MVDEGKEMSVVSENKKCCARVTENKAMVLQDEASLYFWRERETGRGSMTRYRR